MLDGNKVKVWEITDLINPFSSIMVATCDDFVDYRTICRQLDTKPGGDKL